MAVYTHLSVEELQVLSDCYQLGALTDWEGIAEGVENSNYRVEFGETRAILTIYEKRVETGDLPFFLGLMTHIAARGITCPKPYITREGETLMTLQGKPAALFSFLEGRGARRITSPRCAAVGEALAQMHLAAADFPGTRPNTFGLTRWRKMFTALEPRLDTVKHALRDALAGELDFLDTHWPGADALPRGIVHADLFPDNVLFTGDEVTGMIDFYFACEDVYMYDLAIVLNAWCFEAHSEFNLTKSRALLSAYHAVRPLSAEECAALPVLARGAALRFLLTRLWDWLNPQDGARVTPKNPLEYLRRLQFHQTAKNTLSYGFRG